MDVSCHDPGPAGCGARVYAGALAGSGGREIEALQRSGDPNALAVALYASPPYDVQVPPLAVSRLSINLTASTVQGAIDGERRRTYRAPRHSLFVTPAGASAAWHKAAPSRHINIYFHTEAFSVRTAPLLAGLLPGGGALFDALAEELAAGDAFAAEAVDGLARLILVRLMRRPPRDAALRLSDPQLRRLREFVAARLHERLLVADLAAAAGLPPNRFARAFAAHTGQAPHQYLLARRIERARELLHQTGRPLAEIAADCGFASQQHMTQAMSRRLGQSPARLRAEMAGQGSSACPGSRCA